MGNSYSSNNEQVVKSLSGKVDGIPIWPPIKKLSPLDVVVVHKNGSVTSLGDPLKAKQLDNVQDMEGLQQLGDNLETVTHDPYKISDANDLSGEARASLLQSFGTANGKIAISNHKDVSISIDEMRVTTISTKDDSDALKLLKDALTGAKIDDLYDRRNKHIYVITQVTNTTGFTLASSKHSDAEVELKVLPDDSLGFKLSSETSTNFETSDTLVTIAIKALRFHVSADGTLENAKRVQINKTRSGEEVNLVEVEEELNNLDNGKDVTEKYPKTARNKMALLIGNNKYQHISRLNGCENDVKKFKAYLENAGFQDLDKHAHTNLTYDEMLKAMNSFASGAGNNIKEGDLVVFYYAGHGCRRRADTGEDGKGAFEIYEETICPIDSYPINGDNRDISRDMIQAWVGKLEKMGAKVLLFFDSCHSGGMIRGEQDDKISEGCRTTRGDNRTVTQQCRPNIPDDCDWLEDLKKGRPIHSATTRSENIACLAACKRTEYARETVLGGAMTTELIRILESTNNDPNLSFLQIMEKLMEALKDQDPKKEQNPDISGNIDTVAFCMKNLTIGSPHPYILTEVVSTSNDKALTEIRFLSAYMLPLVTKGSEFHLYDVLDSTMSSSLGTVKVDEISKDNLAKVTVSDVAEDVIFSENKVLRAVQVYHSHETGNSKYYTKVKVNGTSPELEKLRDILRDTRRSMFHGRMKVPVKALPPSSFAILLEDDNDAADITIQMSNDKLISVSDKEGMLVLPRVELEPLEPSTIDEKKLYLVASYISSYAHWNMVHRLSNPSTKIMDGGKNKFQFSVLKGKDGVAISPNDEGVYELDWNSREDESEEFQICAKIDSDETFAIMVAELDVDHGVYYNQKYFEEVSPSNVYRFSLFNRKNMSLCIADVVKESNDKWCTPYFEWKVVISTVRKTAGGSLEEGMKFLESEGVLLPDYSECEELDPNEKFLARRKGRAKEQKVFAEDWTCFSFKFTVPKLGEYARTTNTADL